MEEVVNFEKTAKARAKWDRNAPFYDLMSRFMETQRARKWYVKLWGSVKDPSVLEVGVGTGKSFPFYPRGLKITAIDFSSGMLVRAEQKARQLGLPVTLKQMDVQQMEFTDNSFDTVVASCVFCSVPDPVQGLKEVKRVCKPGGKVILLEHVLSANRLIASLMNLTNPLLVRMMGANINRQTVTNVHLSGLNVEKVTDLAAGIFKLIEARKEFLI